MVIGSHNPDKVIEIESILASAGIEVIRGLDWPEVDETGGTLEANALLKARAVFEATGVSALADDTGLFVNAIDGAPGIRTARFAGEGATYGDNVVLLLERLEGVVDRSATFRTVVALVGKGEEALGIGELKGTIANSARGRNGFGYDPVFQLENGRTLAELADGEKNLVSHRARAILDLVGRISS